MIPRRRAWFAPASRPLARMVQGCGWPNSCTNRYAPQLEAPPEGKGLHYRYLIIVLTAFSVAGP